MSPFAPRTKRKRNDRRSGRRQSCDLDHSNLRRPNPLDIRDHLRKITNNGEKEVRQIEFVGKRFDVMSVRRWRDRALTANLE